MIGRRAFLRDPLKIPCLTERYWATFPERNGRYLAAALAAVRKYPSKLEPLSGLSQETRPQREEEKFKESLSYFRERIQ